MQSHVNAHVMDVKELRAANERIKVGRYESLMRILAVVLTLTAAIVHGLDKQTKVVPVEVVPTLPAIYVPVTNKWYYQSAFVYFLVANVIACVYATLSLVLSFANRGTRKSSLWLLIIVLDLLMVALLWSAFGAAGTIGVLGYYGNSHARWNKVCNVFGRFCHQVLASMVLSGFAALAFMFLVVLALLRFRKAST